ncbi:hypothetical protein BFC21_08590 [Pseudomonas sp. TMW 2.1634]|nr:hypothetical protein BFC21_08590 [Pseudomonas sp. TMW 2.1634]
MPPPKRIWQLIIECAGPIPSFQTKPLNHCINFRLNKLVQIRNSTGIQYINSCALRQIIKNSLELLIS